jgi:hypothetical protein
LEENKCQWVWTQKSSKPRELRNIKATRDACYDYRENLFFSTISLLGPKVIRVISSHPKLLRVMCCGGISPCGGSIGRRREGRTLGEIEHGEVGRRVKCGRVEDCVPSLMPM